MPSTITARGPAESYAPGMSAFKIQDWGDGDGTAFVILDDELVPATEAAIAEVAHSAMLLLV